MPLVELTEEPANSTSGSPLQRVGQRFMILAAGEVAARLIAFGTTVYLARALGASAYGIVGFATAVTLYLARIADGGIEYFGLGIREVASNPGRADAIVPGITIARLGISIILLVVLAAVALVFPLPETAVLALYGLTLVSLAGSTRWVVLGLERAEAAASSRVVGESLVAALVLVLVGSSDDVLRIPVAQFLGDSLAAMILLAVLWRSGIRLTLRPDFAVVRPIFRRSWRLVLSALLGLVIYNSDLILLRFFRDSASVGFYAAAYTFISFLLNLGGTYNQSLIPALTRESAPRSARSGLYQGALAHTFAIGLPIAVGGWLLADGIVGLTFGDRYAAGVLPLQILVWSIPLALMREVATAGLMARGGEAAVLRFTMWTAVASLILNFSLIPRYGMAGAAFATAATEAFRFGASILLARARGLQPLAARRLLKPAAAAAIMGAAVWTIGRDGVLTALVVGVAAYGVTLAALGGISFARGRFPSLAV